MMAEDPTLEDEIDTRIADGKTAEWAVYDAFAVVPRRSWRRSAATSASAPPTSTTSPSA